MNANAKYTPGPWEVDSGMVQTAYDRLSSGLRIPIAYMDREPNNGTVPVERDANASLIAAAPDLLAEAEKILRAARGKLTNGECEGLEAAIRKAKGDA